MGLEIAEIVRMIVAARADAAVTSCRLHVLHRDRRYDEDDRYYAGSGMNADTYKPLQEFYGEGYIEVREPFLVGGETELRSYLEQRLYEYDQTLSSRYENAVVDDISIDQQVYQHPESHETYALILPDLTSIDAELIAYLASHPEDLYSMNWRLFEELLSAIFRNQGFQVELGPGRGDEGVDLRLIHKDSIGTMLTLVQAKRYRRARKITIEAVSSLKAIVHAHQAHRGAFVTTSDFLPGTRKWAEAYARELTLINHDVVLSWLRNLNPAGRRT